MTKFKLQKAKWKLPVSISKLYENNDYKVDGDVLITYVDEFPVIGSNKSICYKSEKPISKMFSNEIL